MCASWGDVEWKGEEADYAAAAAELFNISYDEALQLFSSPGQSKYDDELYERKEDPTSKQLFKNRIREFLAEHGQPVNPDF